MDLKCKDCIFFTGVECHGHGDFWGSCNLLHLLYKFLNKDYLCSLNYEAICFEDTNCKFSKYVEIISDRKK